MPVLLVMLQTQNLPPARV